MKSLKGNKVAEKIHNEIKHELQLLDKKPNIAILALEGDYASNVYIKRIQKNCEKFEIGIQLYIAKTEQEFIEYFNMVRDNPEISGIMFQQPLPNNLMKLIDKIPPEKDIEGIGIHNMGKLFIGKEAVLIPCTSKAVIETLDFYEIDLEGKDVVLIGRSNIVGKPLIPQLLEKNATVTICHSRTKNLQEKTSKADVVIVAIGKANFLKAKDIKQGAVLIDVGINYENGKLTGDIDYNDVESKASECTPVPGGIGTVTNALLIQNIIKSAKNMNKGK